VCVNLHESLEAFLLLVVSCSHINIRGEAVFSRKISVRFGGFTAYFKKDKLP